MKHTIKKTILYFAIFAFAFLGSFVLAEENEEDRSLEALLQKIEEIAEIVQEMKEQGELLVEEPECELYLTEYIGYGRDNNPEEVERLQTFLNEEEGESLPVTGFYGEMTLAAVNRLQVKYASEILEPWGITEPTGYVYKTTTTFINNRKCPEVVLEIPVLVPDTTYTTTTTITIETAEERATQETIEREEERVSEEDENGEEGWIEENWEELRATEEDEEDNGDNFAWALIIIGSLGLGLVLYNIYTFKSKDQPKKQ